MTKKKRLLEYQPMLVLASRVFLGMSWMTLQIMKEKKNVHR